MLDVSSIQTTLSRLQLAPAAGSEVHLANILKAVADLDTLSKQLMHRPSAIFKTGKKKFCVAIFLIERRETYSYEVIYII